MFPIDLQCSAIWCCGVIVRVPSSDKVNAFEIIQNLAVKNDVSVSS